MNLSPHTNNTNTNTNTNNPSSGDYFGEAALVESGNVRTANVIAMEPGRAKERNPNLPNITFRPQQLQYTL